MIPESFRIGRLDKGNKNRRKQTREKETGVGTSEKVEEILQALKRKAAGDPLFLSAVLRTAEDKDPLASFCSLSTKAGYPLYEMDLIEAGEEAYAAMKRSTNGGGENSPMLEYQDDYYAMFLAEMKRMERDQTG